MNKIDMNADGDYPLNTSASRVALSVGGNFGTATVSVGFYTSPGAPGTFRPFVDLNLMAVPFDKLVNKGQAINVIIRVSGAAGTSLSAIYSPVT
jgi:hypothetical protein